MNVFRPETLVNMFARHLHQESNVKIEKAAAPPGRMGFVGSNIANL